MVVYDFEVLKGELLVASKRLITLPNVGAAWTKIAKLAEAIDGPGYKIRVKDQSGGIVILIGIAALRRCADALRRRNCARSPRVGSLPLAAAGLGHVNLSEAEWRLLARQR